MGDYYRIHISSANVQSGTITDGFYHVSVPIQQFNNDEDWQIVVESFSTQITFSGEPYMVLTNISLGDSCWSTLNGGGTQNILLAADSHTFFRYIDANSIGSKISNPIQFNNGLIQIKIVDGVSGVTLDPSTFANTSGTNGWCMVLVIYSKPKINK